MELENYEYTLFNIPSYIFEKAFSIETSLQFST